MSRKGRKGREKSKQEEKQIFGRLDEDKKRRKGKEKEGNERRRQGRKGEEQTGRKADIWKVR